MSINSIHQSTAPAKQAESLLVLLLTYAAFISLGLPDGIMGAAWPQMRADFGVSLNANWPIYIVGMAGGLISGISAGSILRHMRVGRLLLFTTLLTGGTLLACGLSPWFSLVVALAFLLGLGNGAIDAGLNHFVATHLSSRHMNWLHAFWGVGVSLGTLLLSGITSVGGNWRHACLAVCGLQFALAVCFVFHLKIWDAPGSVKSPEAREPAEEKTSTHATTAETLSQPASWLCLLCFFLYCGIEFSAGVWTTSLLQTGRGWAADRAALMVTLFWGSLTAGRFGIGFVSNHFRPGQILRTALLGVISGTLLISLSGLMHAPALAGLVSACGLLITGLCLAPIYPTLMHDTPACVGKAHAVNLIGLQAAAANIGLTLLPGLLGTLMKHSSLELLGPSLLGMALLLLALITLRERSKRNLHLQRSH